jgi:hypothetical protein
MPTDTRKFKMAVDNNNCRYKWDISETPTPISMFRGCQVQFKHWYATPIHVGKFEIASAKPEIKLSSGSNWLHSMVNFCTVTLRAILKKLKLCYAWLFRGNYTQQLLCTKQGLSCYRFQFVSRHFETSSVVWFRTITPFNKALILTEISRNYG